MHLAYSTAQYVGSWPDGMDAMSTSNNCDCQATDGKLVAHAYGIET